MTEKILDMRKINFLVVDDSFFNRRLYREIIRQLGATAIIEAFDGVEALKAVQSNPIHIIVSDWDMQPVDGIELTRKIRRDPTLEDPFIPVIMISGRGLATEVGQARDAGVTEYLQAPISPRDLYLRIKGVILRPRKNVKCPNFIGPDRHRHENDTYEGELRRADDSASEVETKGVNEVG